MLIIVFSLCLPSLMDETTIHQDMKTLIEKFNEQQREINQLFEINRELNEKIENLEKENREQEKHLTQETSKKIEMDELHEVIERINVTTYQNTKSNNVLREPPAIFYCSWKDHFYSTSSVITYDGISYSRDNQATGGLDTSTGYFTAGYPGTYTVTWGLQADISDGERYVSIHLYKNGASVGSPGWHVSDFSGISGGHVWDQGGKSLITHLDLGETLSLYC